MATMRNKVAALGFDARMMVARFMLEAESYDVIRKELKMWGVQEEEMPSDDSFRAYEKAEEYQRVYDKAMDLAMFAEEAVRIDDDLETMGKVAELRRLKMLCRAMEDEGLSLEEKLTICDRLQRDRRLEDAECRQLLAERKFRHVEQTWGMEKLFRISTLVMRMMAATRRTDVPEAVADGLRTLMLDLMQRGIIANDANLAMFARMKTDAATADAATASPAADAEQATESEAESGLMGVNGGCLDLDGLSAKDMAAITRIAAKTAATESEAESGLIGVDGGYSDLDGLTAEDEAAISRVAALTDRELEAALSASPTRRVQVVALSRVPIEQALRELGGDPSLSTEEFALRQRLVLHLKDQAAQQLQAG
jgi:hypothetical protein